MRPVWIVLAVIVFALLLAFVPAALFWSIRVLFGFTIPFTFATWFAAWVLLTLVNGGHGVSSK